MAGWRGQGKGLLGFFIGPHPQQLNYQLRGLQLITWNLFVLAGLVMFGFAAGAAVGSWLGRPGADDAELGEP